MKKLFLLAGIIAAGFEFSYSQNIPVSGEKVNYVQVITKRAEKIVSVLGITDSAKFKRVQDIVINQYENLSAVHDGRNAKVKEIKEQPGVDKTAANSQIAAIDSNVDVQLNNLHVQYLSKLSHELTSAQIEAVKDAMTYKILPLTYNAYLNELPALTDTQKSQIKTWLTEARECAIDAESSEKKHAWFGKYKGRINNYLSAQGYDMKKAGQEWQKRLKEKAGEKG